MSRLTISQGWSALVLVALVTWVVVGVGLFQVQDPAMVGSVVEPVTTWDPFVRNVP